MKKLFTIFFNFLLAVNVTLQVDMSSVEFSPQADTAKTAVVLGVDAGLPH